MFSWLTSLTCLAENTKNCYWFCFQAVFERNFCDIFKKDYYKYCPKKQFILQRRIFTEVVLFSRVAFETKYNEKTRKKQKKRFLVFNQFQITIIYFLFFFSFNISINTIHFPKANGSRKTSTSFFLISVLSLAKNQKL